MYLFRLKKNNYGFTIIELIVVIGVIAILSIIAIPFYKSLNDKAGYASDTASVTVLNNATAAYATMKNIEITEAFDGISNDSQKIAFLANENYIADEVSPVQEDAVFAWLDEADLWALQGGLVVDDEGGDPDRSYPTWEPKIKYDKGTYLTYNGKTYYSHRKTNKEPGKSNHWQEVSDYWVKLNTYKKGDTIIYNGKTYIAVKNNRDKDPEKKTKVWVLVE